MVPQVTASFFYRPTPAASLRGWSRARRHYLPCTRFPLPSHLPALCVPKPEGSGQSGMVTKGKNFGFRQTWSLVPALSLGALCKIFHFSELQCPRL